MRVRPETRDQVQIGGLTMNENGYDAASMVCLPRHEYARLVAAKAKMDMVEKMGERYPAAVLRRVHITWRFLKG